jgi:hypothetical protein
VDRAGGQARPEMTFVYRYFFLLLLTIVAANLLAHRRRLRQFEADGGIARAEADRLLRAMLVWGGGYFGALAVIQLAAGWPSPFCVHARPLHDPYVLASWMVTAGALAVLAAWVFTRGGDELLSRASPALGRTAARTPAWTPRGVRMGTAVLVVLTGVAGAMPRLVGPPLPCEAPVFGPPPEASDG